VAKKEGCAEHAVIRAERFHVSLNRAERLVKKKRIRTVLFFGDWRCPFLLPTSWLCAGADLTDKQARNGTPWHVHNDNTDA